MPAGSENCTQVAMDLVKNKLKVTINPSDISIEYRIGKHLANNPDSRKILVKLCGRDLKADLVGAVKTMKPSNLYISESLTPQNETMSYVLRRARKDFDQIISGNTTVDGIKYVCVKPPNAHVPGAKSIRHEISTHRALSSFYSQTLHRPLTHYVPEWKHSLSYYCQKTVISPAVYYLITAYLYITSISLFKYLITCLPTRASYYTSIPALALLTNFHLPLHKTLVCKYQQEPLGLLPCLRLHMGSM